MTELLPKMSGVDFISSAVRGDIIEIGMETIKFGKTSITIQMLEINVRWKIITRCR